MLLVFQSPASAGRQTPPLPFRNLARQFAVTTSEMLSLFWKHQHFLVCQALKQEEKSRHRLTGLGFDVSRWWNIFHHSQGNREHPYHGVRLASQQPSYFSSFRTQCFSPSEESPNCIIWPPWPCYVSQSLLSCRIPLLRTSLILQWKPQLLA